jgi:hypothetical protein
MDTKIHEVKELIAERIPPGDNWELVIHRIEIMLLKG